jgi:hypothetical protein
LETSVPLESPRQVHISALNQSAPQQTNLATEQDLIMTPSVVAEETVQILEERLMVNRIKRKVGEVTIRKEIETRIIEVPVRREKLIVEQVSPEYKQLAVVDLGQVQGQVQEQVQEQKLGREAASTPLPSTVEGSFTSITAAIQFLEAIAAQSNSVEAVKVSVVLKDDTLGAI